MKKEVIQKALHVVSLSAAIAVLLPYAGRTETVPGGVYHWSDKVDDKWSTVENWDEGELPKSNSEVCVNATRGTLIIDQEGGVTVWRIRPESVNTIITGSPVTLCAGSWTTADSRCIENATGTASGWNLTFDVPVTVTPPKSGPTGFSFKGHLYFRKPVTVTSNGGGWFTFNTADAIFYDSFCASGISVKDPSASAKVTFVKPVNVATMQWGLYNANPLTFGVAGNTVGQLQVSGDKANICIGQENAFTENTYIGQETTAGSGLGTLNLCNHNQIFSRVQGVSVSTKDSWSIRSFIDNVAAPTVLTLKGLQDAYTTFRVQDQISIVWDPAGDFVQCFSNRVNETRGSITVKGGVFRVAGTASFPNLASIDVKSGATFDLDSTVANALANVRHLRLSGRLALGALAATPFSGGVTVAKIAPGGKIAVGANHTITLAGVEWNGAYLADGSYSGEDWIDGAGIVVIDSSKVAIWKTAASGSWETASNWVGEAVPTSTQNVYVDAEGVEDYTVRISETTTLPKQVDIFNLGGGKASLLIGAAVTHNNGRLFVGRSSSFEILSEASLAADLAGLSTSTSTIDNPVQIVDGGVYRVAGTVSYSNFAGCFGLGGQGVETGRFEMVSGSFSYTTKSANNDNAIVISDHGQVSLTGGEMTIPANYQTPAVRLFGGEFKAAGTAVVQGAPGQEGLVIARKGGRFVVAGSAQWPNEGRAYPNTEDVSFNPAFAGGTLTIDVSGDADYAGVSYHKLNLGNDSGARICATFGGAGRDFITTETTFASGLRIGGGSGSLAELSIPAGNLRLKDNGIFVGQTRSAYPTMNEGILYLSGGNLYNKSGSTGYSKNEMNGFIVGQMYTTAIHAGRYSTGRVVMSAGEVTNSEGNSIVIGSGYATGEWKHSGGSLSDRSDFIVGAAHGLGTFELSGGSVSVTKSVFIGGFAPDLLAANTFDVAAMQSNGWPFDLHDAEGTLRIKDGTMDARSYDSKFLNTYVGLDGIGTIEMVGTAGTLLLGNLFLTNNVAQTTVTGAILSFELGASGVSPVECYGNVEIATGTKVRVDFSDYIGKTRRHVLLKTMTEGKKITGVIQPQDVEAVGLPEQSKCVLEQTDTEIVARLKSTRGLVLMVR